jgi:hypothetical protein
LLREVIYLQGSLWGRLWIRSDGELTLSDNNPEVSEEWYRFQQQRASEPNFNFNTIEINLPVAYVYGRNLLPFIMRCCCYGKRAAGTNSVNIQIDRATVTSLAEITSQGRTSHNNILYIPCSDGVRSIQPRSILKRGDDDFWNRDNDDEIDIKGNDNEIDVRGNDNEISKRNYKLIFAALVGSGILVVVVSNVIPWANIIAIAAMATKITISVIGSTIAAGLLIAAIIVGYKNSVFNGCCDHMYQNLVEYCHDLRSSTQEQNQGQDIR